MDVTVGPDPAFVPAASSRDASRPSGLQSGVGREKDPLKLSVFVCAIRDRFKVRAELTDAQATLCALAALETWEDADEPIELSYDCANEIADTDLEHWDAE